MSRFSVLKKMFSELSDLMDEDQLTPGRYFKGLGRIYKDANDRVDEIDRRQLEEKQEKRK